MSRSKIEASFPRLAKVVYGITSPVTISYNCIAWAAGDDRRWWWPAGSYFWPMGIDRVESLEAFKKAFEHLGYRTCDNASLEEGVEKIAIFAWPSGKPSHAARQLASGSWTSKLGQAWDISHPLYALEGKEYGDVALLMKRTRPQPSS